ncbi:MAG: sodium:solute symporter family protein [Ruminiclostridium sp.]|nr:sodium:solute symporter family protein [Ruminiclostridium sp.]
MIAKIIVTIIYVAIVGYLGYLGYRNTKNAQDYLIGGRKIHPAVMALSYGAAFISTSAIIGFGGTAARFGMSLLWLTFFNIFLGIFVAFVFFGRRTRRMGLNLGAHTFPEFIGARYQSKFIQRFAACIIFFLMPVYAAAVMIGAATFIKSNLGIDYNTALFFFAAICALYVFFGGLKGVMYTDAFQGTLMFIGMLMFIITVYSRLGGFTAAHQKLTNMMNDPLVLDQIKSVKLPPGFNGWASMPELFSVNWWAVISSLVLGVGIGVLAQPQLVVRFMTVKSDREINRAVPIGGLFILFMTGVAFAAGALSNVFFFEKHQKIAEVFSGGADYVMGDFVGEIMPAWFLPVFLIVIVAAGMSTLSSQFHAIGTAFGRDMFNNENRSEKSSMLMSRTGMLVAIIITIILAYVLPSVWNGAIAISTGLFFGVCASCFLPLYVGAIYFRKMSKKAAVSGMLAGFGTSALWMLFIHTKESQVLGLCKALFGVDTLAPAASTLAFVDPIVIALTVSIIVTVVVGLLTKPDLDEEHLHKCFSGIVRS